MKHLFITTIILLITGLSASGQSPWLDTGNTNFIAIEWQKPNFNFNLDSNDKTRALSSVLFVTGKYSIWEGLNIVAELPLSHWGLDDGDGIDQQDAHTTIGNIYAGGEYSIPENNPRIDVLAELGLRLPTLPEPGFPDRRGAFTGFVISKDRREAFMDDFIPITLFGNVLIAPEKDLQFRIRAGALYSFYTGDIEEGRHEAHFLYSAQARYQSFIVNGIFGITGRTDLRRNENIFGIGRPTTQLWVKMEKKLMGWAPGLYIRIPINKNSDFVTYVAGLEANIYF